MPEESHRLGPAPNFGPDIPISHSSYLDLDVQMIITRSQPSQLISARPLAQPLHPTPTPTPACVTPARPSSPGLSLPSHQMAL